MLELLFLLLPVAAGYGYVMGRNSVRQAQRKQSKRLSRHYFKGLNFLLSDQPDKAVDTLIKMIDVNSDTVETHIAMGSFFRHRGELDRAIRIHQNLVEKQQISATQRETALKELGRDYLLAGFLEQAENVALQLLDSDKYFLDAQKQLFTIYQNTKEWERAIELAEKMAQCHGDTEDLGQRVAHFYCEQAAIYRRKEKLEQAETCLQKAILSDERAVRPWLMLGSMALEQDRADTAMSYLEQVPERDTTWLSEAIPLMAHCAAVSDKAQASFQHILDTYYDQCATAYLAKVELMALQGDSDAAKTFLLKQLRQHPTMRGFSSLMQLMLKDEQRSQDMDQTLHLLLELVQEQIQQRPTYRCTSCGFSGGQVYWLCPSCKHWGVVKPIKGLDGE